jgi:methyl-accepting chemotaxis protein PixJ
MHPQPPKRIGQSPIVSPQQIRSFLQQHLVGTIVVSICLNLGLTGASIWGAKNTVQHLEMTISTQNRQQDLSDRLTYLDEVLTMSAQMFVSTGQPMWEERYKAHAPKIDKVLAELTQAAPPSTKIDAANKKLLELEDKAFKLAKQSNLTAASAVLLSPEYQQNKQIYAAGVASTIAQIKEVGDRQIRGDRQMLSDAVLLVSIGVCLIAITNSLVIVTVKSYIRDRTQSQASLQANLRELNEELQDEDRRRATQQERIIQESANLQTDVDHILKMVSLLENGDLTVRMDVSDGATGLISETLNRTIDSLHQTMGMVVSSADRVAINAVGLEQLAVETANQAQQQTRSIQQIEMSIAQVNSLSDNSYEQALATIDAVELAQAAIGNGQQEMNAMADGIASLQQGTEQIVKRMQNLNEFVELAAQFSKDHKRVAALTRVLALNASLLATRALAERDPAQFASLAHEFQTIAERVNELAEDSNSSLATLQHRTNQIQTVTSGLDRDIADIDRLVQKFTDEMGKSRQAFTNIQLVTDRVAIVGERVSSSSQDIIQVVGDTLTAIQAIGTIAQNTEHKAIATQEQIQVTKHLANNLLERVEFFQLHDSPKERLTQHIPLESPNFLPPADSTVVKNPEVVYELFLPSEKVES